MQVMWQEILDDRREFEAIEFFFYIKELQRSSIHNTALHRSLTYLHALNKVRYFLDSQFQPQNKEYKLWSSIQKKNLNKKASIVHKNQRQKCDYKFHLKNFWRIISSDF